MGAPEPTPRQELVSRSSTIRRVRRRARQIATIALTVGVGCAAFVTNGFGASAGAAAAAVPAVPTFTLHKANFAIAPGAGFFLDEAHIRRRTPAATRSA